MPTDLTLPLVPARCATDASVAQRFVLVIAMLLYCFTLRAGWAIDDKKAILNNPDIVGQQPAILSNDYWGMPMSSPKSHKSYRPITILSFKLDHSLVGLAPWFFHAINVVLYGAVCSKFTHVAINIFGSVAHGFLAGMLFATHPIHTESVANVVNRAELLAALFFLWSFSAFQGGVDTDLGLSRPRGKGVLSSKHQTLPAWLCSSLALSLMALFSKEAGITVLAVCVLYDAVRSSEASGADGHLTPAFVAQVLRLLVGGGRNGPGSSVGNSGATKGKGKGGKKVGDTQSEGDAVLRRFVRRATLIALFLVVVVIVRTVVLMGGSKAYLTLRHQNPAALIAEPKGRLLSRWYIYACNAWLLLWPGAKLCYDYGMGVVPLVHDITDTKNLWACALYASLFCLSYLALFSTVARKTRLVLAVGLAMMIGPFVPAANIFMSVGFTIAERTLFLPSAGFCLLAAQAWIALQAWLARRKLASVLPWLLFVVLLLCAGRVVQRNEDWITEERVYQSCIEVFPNNANCVYNLGTIRKDQGRADESMALFKTAVELNPKFSIARNNYANALARNKRFDEAEPVFKEALRINPINAGAWANYASLILDADSKKKDLAKWARLDEAINAVEKSARLQPDHKGIADRLKSYRRLQLQLKNHNSQ